MPPAMSPQSAAPTSRIGRQVLGQRPLEERQILVGLQALEPERRLELAGAQPHERRRVDVGVRVEDHHGAAREVGRETKIRDVQDRAVEPRPEPPQQERVQTIGEVGVSEEPARVGLELQAEAQLVRAVRAANAESALVGDNAGALLGLRRQLLFEELELAPRDARVLIRLLHFSGQSGEGRGVDGRCGGRRRRRRLGRRRRRRDRARWCIGRAVREGRPAPTRRWRW